VTTLTLQPDSPTQSTPAADLLWGLDARALHDRFWASRCVQVVRAGHAEPIQKGPQLYLLIEPDSLLLFDPSELLERMRWLKPRSVRMRLVDHHEKAYEERVIAHPDGRFECIRRYYRPRARATGRAWFTEDPALADTWARSADFTVANRAMKSAHRRGSVMPWRQAGVVIDTARPAELERLRRVIQQTWTDPGAAIDTIYAHAPGIWVHESVVVPAGVRFIPPVWIGAGVRLTQDQVVPGPAILADLRRPDMLPSPVDWKDVEARPPLITDPSAVTSVMRSRKRLFDVAFSLAALAVTLPLYPFIMLAILFEDGPPFFFAHRRQTLGGREFPCIKFRTMVRNAERIKAELVAQNVCDGAHFYVKDDPRVTRVGRFLRKYHLDELPQFWNVLVGHMSVVGPRPSPDKENQYCPAWREARLSVRPGVTGLWQVRRTRAASTDFQEWVRYDLEYVQRQSFAFDIRIIFDTIRQILRV
jgi:lipopolysaccharide/colanic/teichoic acid biosynthesis glycosyltransferase